MEVQITANGLDVKILNASPDEIRKIILNGSAGDSYVSSKPTVTARPEHPNTPKKLETSRKSEGPRIELPNDWKAWSKALPIKRIRKWHSLANRRLSSGIWDKPRGGKHYYYLAIKNNKMTFWTKVDSIETAWELRNAIFKNTINKQVPVTR